MESAMEVGIGSINRGWGATFVLSGLALLLIWFAVPGTDKLVVGKDGRMSTSKFQAVMWTMVVVFALFSLFFGYLIVQLGDLFNVAWAEHLNNPLGESFNAFFAEKFDSNYLVLLGLPLGTAVASKAITTNKVANGTVVKTPETGEGAGTLQELIGDDGGNTDLGDFQYLLFNFLAVAYFLVAFMSHPSQGLPSLPDTLIGLTGIAAATYIGKKSVFKEPPILLGVLPPSGKPGDTVTIYGQQLLTSAEAGVAAGAPVAAPAPAALGVTVVIGGHAAAVQGEPSNTNVVVEVPVMPAGPTELNVLRPPGASSDSLPFVVLPA